MQIVGKRNKNDEIIITTTTTKYFKCLQRYYKCNNEHKYEGKLVRFRLINNYFTLFFFHS